MALKDFCSGKPNLFKKKDAEPSSASPKSLKQSGAAQQCIRFRFFSAEADIQFHRLFGSAFRQDIIAETRCDFGVENAFFLEKLKRIGVEHLGPFVTVIARRVAALKDVRKRSTHAIFGYVRIEFGTFKRRIFKGFYI